MFCITLQVFHVEDVIEEIGYVLEKDSEYCQKFLEEEEEITINVTKKGGEITKYQVKQLFYSLMVYSCLVCFPSPLETLLDKSLASSLSDT